MPRLRSITAAAALAGLLLGGTASADDCPPQATGARQINTKRSDGGD